MFKQFHIWTFGGQNVGPFWVKSGKKRYLTTNPVLPKN